MNAALLKAVSRSFFLSVKWLPREMREAVGVAYMLARATDSVADTSSAAPEKREQVLAGMARVIAGEAGEEERKILLGELGGEMSRQQSHSGECLLLQRFEECLSELDSFPCEIRDLVRHVLHTIIQGQQWDLSYFRSRHGVEEDAQTLLYADQVAGCVGKFWTRLGALVLGERFCDLGRVEVMEQAAIRYGRGLQLINILRDREEDAARGRSYLCSSPAKWMQRAERYMNDGVDYSRRLRGFRVRFASMLPALIGKKTLAALHRAKGRGKVRIPRRSVYGCMAKALLISSFPRVF